MLHNFPQRIGIKTSPGVNKNSFTGQSSGSVEHHFSTKIESEFLPELTVHATGLAHGLKNAEAYSMDQKLLDSLIDQIKKQRREWVREGAEGGDATRKTTEARKDELKEKALAERATRGGENLDNKKNDTMRELDAVLERIETGKFGICEQCGRSIEDERLSANPNITLCSACEAKGKQKREK
jgi:RNA polymerase-binding transcription factor DksA